MHRRRLSSLSVQRELARESLEARGLANHKVAIKLSINRQHDRVIALMISLLKMFVMRRLRFQSCFHIFLSKAMFYIAGHREFECSLWLNELV